MCEECSTGVADVSNRSVWPVLGAAVSSLMVFSAMQQGYWCTVQELSLHAPYWEVEGKGTVCMNKHCEHLGSATGMMPWQVEMPSGHDGAFCL